MPQDSFSRCHPAANFLFFVAVIGLGVTIQHPGAEYEPLSVDVNLSNT